MSSEDLTLKLTQIQLGQLIQEIATSSAVQNAGLRDSFGRNRTSLSYQEVDLKFTHDTRTDVMCAIAAGTGAVAHGGAGKSYATMTVAAAADRATFRTRVPQRYRAGQSLQFIATSVLPAGEVGLEQRVGYMGGPLNAVTGFTDGCYLLESGGILSFVVKNSIDSTINATAQAEWNQDVFDGSGSADNPSGLSINKEASLLLVVDLQYLGIGQVRFGFERGGNFYPAHFEDYSNVGVTAYMQSANLHLAWDLYATPAYLGAGATMRAICGTVIREGGNEEPITNFTSNSGVVVGAAVNATVETSLVAVRIVDLHKYHSTILPIGVSLTSVAASTFGRWAIWRQNATDFAAATGVPSWTSVGDESIAEYCIVRLALSNTASTKIYDEGYFSTSNQNRATAAAAIEDTAGLGIDSAGDQDVLIFMVEGVNATNVSVIGSMTWRELR